VSDDAGLALSRRSRNEPWLLQDQGWQKKTEWNHDQEGESLIQVTHLELETQVNRMIRMI